MSRSIHHTSSARLVNHGRISRFYVTPNRAICPKAHNDILLLTYRFSFIQTLIPETDELGHAIKFYPQKQYKGNRKLHKYGKGAFCRFSIIAQKVASVYLLTDGDGNILYIGETRNLRQRFNDSRFGSYGFITPAACYIGGQSTNCKINHLVLIYFEAGQPIQLYFMPTYQHKRIEKDLLQYFHPSYNRRG